MYLRFTLNYLCVPVGLELRNPHAFASLFLGLNSFAAEFLIICMCEWVCARV